VNELFIVMDILQAFENTGAEVTSTSTLEHAMLLVEHDALSGAIVDHGLLDGNSSKLRSRLKDRGIPFLIYSGYSETDVESHGAAPYISKPAPPDVLVDTMADLIRQSESSGLR
jgi:DNA-binding NtrC family response regulator